MNLSTEQKKMDNLENVFEALLHCKTIDEVDNLLVKFSVDEKFHFSEKTYPKIPFKISREEIIELKEKGILASDNTIQDVSGFTAMEKLLYALVWKNGDLQKLKHIVAGILSQSDEPAEKGIVFHQFGKHLSGNNNEPIIDQHVLRAFACSQFGQDQEAEGPYKNLALITKKDKDLIDRYKKWLAEGLTIELRRVPEYTYYVDKVLFALGKSIKHENRGNKP